jgi:hypothetical protein
MRCREFNEGKMRGKMSVMRMRSNQWPKFVAPVVLVANLLMFQGAVAMAAPPEDFPKFVVPGH